MEDINYFEREFLNQAKTYTTKSRDASKAILTNLKKEIHQLSDSQMKLGLSKCVALADNGHTTLPINSTIKIPMKFYRFSDGIFVVKTDSIFSKYLGSKVLKINSIPIDQLEARLFPYVSGVESWKKFKTIDWITSPKILHEIGMGKKDSLTLTLTKNKKILDVSLGANKIENDRPWFEGWSDLYPTSNNDNTWKHINNNKNNLPTYLKHTQEGVFYAFDEQEKIAYFQINGLWEACPNFKEKIKNFNKTLKSHRDYNVVIDLRFYTGGNYAYPIKLASKPPKIINDHKKIYLITSDKTYSAGIVTAARIKHFAKDKIQIIGEPVGDRLKFWAESEAVTLPNSGIRIYNPKKEHDWKDNNRSISRTHMLNFLYGVGVNDLNVNKEIGLSFKDYTENKDPILEWIIGEID